eukprot:1145815_1
MWLVIFKRFIFFFFKLISLEPCMAGADDERNLLYYSPRILPETENDDQKAIIQRFIHSIVREEHDKFNELLPMIDLNESASNNKWSPIIWAIQKDRMWAIKQMFSSTHFIDFSKQIDRKLNRTLLHFAAEKGELELVSLILEKDKQQNQFETNKIDINATDREHSTALFRASKIGAPLIVELLLKHNADPNICNKDDISPLFIASHRGHSDVVKTLIHHEATDINLEDERGRTALMVACAEDRNRIVSLLLKCDNINLNATDLQNFNWNCLMWAIYRKNETILNLLLAHDKKYQIDYLHKNLYGKNSLEMSTEKRLNKKVIQRLRAKYHQLLFPKLIESELIVTLKIPAVVVGILLVFTY